ncbi:MAG: hypothetical protein WBM17_05310 [Anaerolineales bacterium]
MELRVVQTPDRLSVYAPLPAGNRILFLLLSLLSLLAPYELLFRVRWTDYWNFFFLFAAAISAGAVFVSAFLVWAAVAGMNTEMVFDRRMGIFYFAFQAPILRRRVQEHPLSSVRELAVETHEWSDGAPSYSLKAVLGDGKTFSLGSCWSRAEVEAVRERAAVYLNYSASHAVSDDSKNPRSTRREI